MRSLAGLLAGVLVASASASAVAVPIASSSPLVPPQQAATTAATAPVGPARASPEGFRGDVPAYLEAKPFAEIRLPVEVPHEETTGLDGEDEGEKWGMLRWSPLSRELGNLNENPDEDRAPDAKEQRDERRWKEEAKAAEARRIHEEAMAASGCPCGAVSCCPRQPVPPAPTTPPPPAQQQAAANGTEQPPRHGPIAPVMDMVPATVVPASQVREVAPDAAPAHQATASAFRFRSRRLLESAVFGRGTAPDEVRAAIMPAATAEDAEDGGGEGATVEVEGAPQDPAADRADAEGARAVAAEHAGASVEDPGEDAVANVSDPRVRDELVYGAPNATDLVHYPGDAESPFLCHTPEALRKYLDLVGIDHMALSGVAVLSTAYERAGEERRDEQGRVAPDGFHYFMQHGDPDNFSRGRRCFDPEMEYADTLDQVAPGSREVAHGCTPFRVFALKLREAVQCATRVLGPKRWLAIEPDLLSQLSVEAQRQNPQYFAMMAHVTVARYARSERGRLAGVAGLSEALVSTVSACFAGQQRPLTCVPAMSGTTGVLGNGIQDHTPDWIEKQDRAVKVCRVPAGCSRLVSEQLRHFAQANFAPATGEWARMAAPSWSHDCMLGGHEREAWWEDGTPRLANDRLYVSCAYQGLRRACRSAIECCPSTAVHVACRKSLNDPRCADVCEDPFQPAVRLRSQLDRSDDARLDAAEALSDMQVEEDNAAARAEQAREAAKVTPDTVA